MSASTERRTIDLNADLGEGPGEEGLYAWITSANVACGVHAGTLGSMIAAIDRCLEHGVALGAHPSYPDPLDFGRRSPEGPPDEAAIAASVALQVGLLASHARDRGGRLMHVKPHGALYNDAARSAPIARAIAHGVARAAREVTLYGLLNSEALPVWRELGFRVAAEGFADRAYRDDGRLVARGEPGALVVDPAEAARHAVTLARRGDVHTICVHGDTPGAAAILSAVREALVADGLTLAPPQVARGGGRRG